MMGPLTPILNGAPLLTTRQQQLTQTLLPSHASLGSLAFLAPSGYFHDKCPWDTDRASGLYPDCFDAASRLWPYYQEL